MTNKIEIKPHFCEGDPANDINWTKRDATIKDRDGNIIFRQDEVEFPDFWSDRAVKIVTDKYFSGIIGTNKRETSLKHVVNRIVDTITKWGIKDDYFDSDVAKIFSNELKYLLYNQYAAFNSPVYFNVGIKEKPQCAACFLVDVDDSIESIMELATTEAMIFKSGSGAGSNLSNLRGRDEHLSGGGKASGPVSFMKGYDAFAGIIKSGGATRRAAKCVILDIDHLDIKEFINCKMIEEQKIRALIKEGYSSNFEDENSAPSIVAFQNGNHSVRVFDKFMDAVINDGLWYLKSVSDKSIKSIEIKARELFMDICKATYECGDPGLFFSDVSNSYHTCPKSGEIKGTNPCLHGSTLMQTSKGLIPIKELVNKEFKIVDERGKFKKAKGIYSGKKKTIKITFSNGLELIVTPDHKIALDGLINKKGIINSNDKLEFKNSNELNDKIAIRMSVNDVDFNNNQNIMCVDALLLGYGLGNGSPNREQIFDNSNSYHNARIFIRSDGYDDEVAEIFKKRFDDYLLEFESNNSSPYLVSEEFGELWNKYSVVDRVYNRYISKYFLESNKKILAMFLKGLFSANGNVLVKYNKVQLKTSSKKLAQQVVQILSMYGIRSNIGYNESTNVEFSNDIYKCKESYNITISSSYLNNFKKYIGFVQKSKINKLNKIIKKNINNKYYNKIYVKSIKYYGICNVYDFIVESDNHCGGAGGILVHNCFEIVNIPDSSCNLVSMNLKRFVSYTIDNFDFDIESYIKAIFIMSLAQEIMISNASYPTKKITKNTLEHRQLGLGFTNLGALLMYCGLPYDSDEGRSLASAISSLTTASVYKMSTEVAKIKGQFDRLEDNREDMKKVLVKHQKNVEKIKTNIDNIQDIINSSYYLWNSVLEDFDKTGIRNSQATACAPTGTISFMMDADTTGVEPELFLIKTKTMVGGGVIKIVNETIGQSLINLKYNESNRKKIMKYLHENETLDGCPYIKDSHIAIFDTSYTAKPGGRRISTEAHVKMLGAIQPHISGGISKTVNVPREATIQDIWDTYLLAYKLGVKAISIFREGSKSSQPLTIKEEEKVEKVEKQYSKRSLPDERDAKNIRFKLENYVFYLNCGFYNDGTLGEIFIRTAKEGSMVSGLLDTLAILTSISLQYGVPLKVLVNKFSHVKFEPSGFTGRKDIPYAKSIVDLIFRYLDKYIPREEQLEKIEENFDEEGIISSDNRICSNCGNLMIRRGTCYYCNECFESSGCS